MRISDWSSDVCSSDLVGSYRGSSLFCGSPPCGRPNTAQPSRSHLVHGNALGITDPHRHRDAGAHALGDHAEVLELGEEDRKSNTSELQSLMRISYAVFCLKKKKTHTQQ